LERDDFETWLFSIDDELEEFLQSVSTDFAEKLNYSLDSLLEIEAYILEQYDSIDEIMKASNKRALDRLSIYVGESIRKSIGGNWDIELDDSEDVFYKLPVLRHPKFGTECPLTLVTACIDRKKGDYIYKIANVKKRRADS
jgi:hypothetical protein